MDWTELAAIPQSGSLSPAYMGLFAPGVVYYVNFRARDRVGNLSSVQSHDWALPHLLLPSSVWINDRGPYGSSPSTVPTATLRAFVQDPFTDKYYLAGSFLGGDKGQPAPRLARLLANGNLDPDFQIGSGFNDSVWVTLTQPDGKILVGGNFTEFNGAPAKSLIRLLSDGSPDPSFQIGSGFVLQNAEGIIKTSVRALALDSEGKIYVGGRFSSFNGTPAGNLLRLQVN